jgi:glycosyltransferase involved in cell wall biosynthesis
MNHGDSSPAALRPYTQAWYENLCGLLGEHGCKQLGYYVIPSDFVLSVVVPVYNEEATLEHILDRIRAVPLTKEIILIDDCSRDRSREILEELQQKFGDDPDNRMHLSFHDRNRGKGAAVRTGFEQAIGNVVVVQDADLEYDPAEFPHLIWPIVEDKADVVFGSRFLGDRPHRVLYYWHYLANKTLTTLSNWFTNLNITDMETCYKVFRRDVISEILPTLKQNRFGFEPEVTAKIARRKYRVYEMSVSYSGRTYEQGKKIGWRDGVQALWCIFRYGIAD